MSDIFLSSGMRSSLISLQNTASLMEQTDHRLATGQEVNFARDDSFRYFTSERLQSRAEDLSNVNRQLTLDSQMINAAVTGLGSIRKLIDQAQAQLRIARDETDGFQRRETINNYNMILDNIENIAQNSEFRNRNLLGSERSYKFMLNETYTSQHIIQSVNLTDIRTLGLSSLKMGDTGQKTVTLPGVGPISGSTALTSLNNGGQPVFQNEDIIEFYDVETGDKLGGVEINVNMSTQDFMSQVNLGVNNVKVELSATSRSLDFEYTGAVGIKHIKAGGQPRNGNEIDTGLGAETATFQTFSGAVNASDNLNGLDGLAISNTQQINVEFAGRNVNFTYGLDGTTLQDFMDKISADLPDIQLYLDKNSNEIRYIHSDGVSTAAPIITLNSGATQATAANGFGSTNMPAAPSFTSASEAVLKHDLHSTAQISTLITRLTQADQQVENFERDFGYSLNFIQTRVDFSEIMIETLEMGATDLVQADMNEESTKLLSLQTRQQLSTSALSIAQQGEQAVLSLFR